MSRHPFQRASNDKDTVKTPFQEVLVGEIEDYSKNGERMSGRKLSLMLGKSGNHISQMLNDAFIPSGAAILEIAVMLELDRERTDSMIRAAMATKATQRSRDNFWINETLRMLAVRDAERDLFTAFLEDQKLAETFATWTKKHAAKKKPKKSTSKKSPSRKTKRSARSKKG